LNSQEEDIADLWADVDEAFDEVAPMPVEGMAVARSRDRMERLYHRWEQQQWGVFTIDLAPDRAAWRRLPVYVRGELEATISELGGGDVAVTHLLTPLIDAAPDESWRIFLATQLADEAKHAVFFRRYEAEVFRREIPQQGSSGEPTDFADSAYAKEFEPVLHEAVLRVRADPGDAAAWYRASTLYHLITEGVLGVTVLRLGAAITRSRRLYPGLARGIEAIFRDESRHIGFGRAAASAGIAAGFGSEIAAAYLHGVAVAARVMVGPGREEPELPNAGWQRQRGEMKRLRLTETLHRAQHQASMLRIPESREALGAAWAKSCDRAFAEYWTRWSRPHSADGREGGR
jgi:ribonucleoside-diphosphate reductase beta chain